MSYRCEDQRHVWEMTPMLGVAAGEDLAITCRCGGHSITSTRDHDGGWSSEMTRDGTAVMSPRQTPTGPEVWLELTLSASP